MKKTEKKKKKNEIGLENKRKVRGEAKKRLNERKKEKDCKRIQKQGQQIWIVKKTR